MKYFKIKNSLKRKEVGHFPQCETALWDGRFEKDSFNNQGLEGPVLGNPSLPSPILHKSAKLSDYLGVVPLSHTYNVISERFLNFLIHKINTDFQYWPIKVYNHQIRIDRRTGIPIIKDEEKLKEYKYHIFHISYPIKNIVNFSDCLFTVFWYNERSDEIIYSDNLKVRNTNDYEKLRAKYRELNKTREKEKLRIKPKRISISLPRAIDHIFRLNPPIPN